MVGELANVSDRPWRESRVCRLQGTDAERELVRLAAAGEEAAQERLFREWRQPVYRLVSRLLSDPEEVEEATQEAFVRAFRALPRFRGKSSFKTWLFRIAMNAATTRGQRRARDCAREQTYPLSADSHQPDTESLFHAAAEAQSVREAVDELPAPLRTVVVLRYFEELECDEIAEVAGCKIGTVWSRLNQARRVLAEVLAPSRTDQG